MSPWDTLGIAPTDDARAIRRAYAARLKALDPDDRDGFVALRDALDAANDGWWEDDGDEGADVDLPVMVLPAVDAPPFDPDQAAPPWHAEADAIEALVRDGPPDAAVVARVERLLASPEMEQVGTAQAVEDWLAWLIAESMPRADALIEAGARRFGWAAQARDWNCGWAVRRTIQRRDDLAWLAQQPRLSPYGKAWRMLTDPAATPRRREAGPVDRLLQEIDTRRPTLRGDLDEALVERWDFQLQEYRRAREGDANRWALIIIGVIVGGFLVRIWLYL